MPEELIVEVYSREEAGAILSSPSQRADICFLISIGTPDDRPPAGYRNVRDKLRLLFADAVDESGPTEDDIRTLIAVARALANRTGRVLVHCQAGISRSAAAAAIVHAVALGPGREREAIERVLRQREFASPNRRMIEIADRLLELEGRLIEAVEE
ncbi:MAG TPA: dual specificity protein phosphatase family protein [Thermoanaerobaculia bacterium]|nr:dual specificity protein phosphatase family protein [Thermoanaerobaculia bacterium]